MLLLRLDSLELDGISANIMQSAYIRKSRVLHLDKYFWGCT